MAEQPWMVEARKLLGLKEEPGAGNNPTVVKLFAEVGHAGVKTDSTAWCAAFAGAMLERAGYASTRALNARSYLDWGRKITEPVPGCIVVFSRGNSAWQGHVAFYVEDAGSHVKVLGGNQSNAVTIAKYAKSRILGYRMPVAQAAKRPVAPTVKLASPQQVREIQHRLVALRYDPGPIDGEWGPMTRKALNLWRRARNLPDITGDLPEETARQVLALMDPPFKPPQEPVQPREPWPESETAGPGESGSVDPLRLFAGALAMLGVAAGAVYFIGRAAGAW